MGGRNIDLNSDKSPKYRQKLDISTKSADINNILFLGDDTHCRFG